MRDPAHLAQGHQVPPIGIQVDNYVRGGIGVYKLKDIRSTSVKKNDERM